MNQTILFLPDQIKQHMAIEDLDAASQFDAMMNLTGKAFRDVPGRKTLQLKLGEKSYFIKQHFGVGWREIFKNLLSFKKPILSAMTEVAAIQKLDALSILTTPLVAYGQYGMNPATTQSFVITEDLGEICSLEDLCVDWKQSKPEDVFKHSLIKSMAELSAKFHGAGLCHRDFYLCHFVLKKSQLTQGEVALHLIDLHRVLQCQPLNGKTVMKDMAALYFSAMDCGLEDDDFNLFKQYYLSQPDSFWDNVQARANKLYKKFNSRKFQEKLTAERAKIN